MEGAAGVDADGQLTWMNGIGWQLLGRAGGLDGGQVDALLGLSLGEVLARCRAGTPQALCLPRGLGVWVQGAPGSGDGIDFRHAVVAGAPGPAPVLETIGAATPAVVTKAPAATDDGAPSLAVARQRLIEQTLHAHGGNVARTAPARGVARPGLPTRAQAENRLRWGADT